jgi:hypothetical protein
MLKPFSSLTTSLTGLIATSKPTPPSMGIHNKKTPSFKKIMPVRMFPQGETYFK